MFEALNFHFSLYDWLLVFMVTALGTLSAYLKDPQLENQLAVSKKEANGRTFTSITDLDKEGRVEEIARMLGGSSETVRTHAKQLLENNL